MHISKNIAPHEPAIKARQGMVLPKKGRRLIIKPGQTAGANLGKPGLSSLSGDPVQYPPEDLLRNRFSQLGQEVLLDLGPLLGLDDGIEEAGLSPAEFQGARVPFVYPPLEGATLLSADGEVLQIPAVPVHHQHQSVDLVEEGPFILPPCDRDASFRGRVPGPAAHVFLSIG